MVMCTANKSLAEKSIMGRYFKSTSRIAFAFLLAASPCVAASPVPEGPAGAAFYIPPSPLPQAKHGTAVWVRDAPTAVAMPSAARNLLVLYQSLTVDGKPVAVSGTLSIPQGAPPRGGWPLITWTHGTTGITPACAPSLDTQDSTEHSY